MRPDTVYTKTSKGVLEVKDRTIRLPRELGIVFLAVDGKRTVIELLQRTEFDQANLDDALGKLVASGYVKVTSAPSRQATDELDLDFTSPGMISKLNTEAEKRTRAEADAKARAETASRAAADAKAREQVEARAKAAAEANARLQAAAKHRAEEQARQAALATVKAQRDADAATETKARAEAQSRMRQAMAAKANADAEAIERNLLGGRAVGDQHLACPFAEHDKPIDQIEHFSLR